MVRKQKHIDYENCPVEAAQGAVFAVHSFGAIGVGYVERSDLNRLPGHWSGLRIKFVSLNVTR